jgi:hypothetical protein
MRGIRRTAAAVVVAVASLGSAGVVAVATATPSAALQTCTDNWQGPTTGTTAWNASASNWSAGFPTGTDVVCIGVAGTYTVDLNSPASVSAVQVGGGASGAQTLEVDGSAGNNSLSVTTASTVSNRGVLSLDPSASGYALLGGGGVVTVGSGGTLSTTGATGSANAYLRTPITNLAGGKVSIGTPNTVQDQGTLDANAGSFTVTSSGNLPLSGDSSFTQSGGTLKVTGSMSASSGTFTQSGGAESGNAVLLNGGTLADSVGAGSFLIQGSVTLAGSIPSGQTVTVDGSAGNSSLSLGTAVTDSGTLVQNASPAGFALVTGDTLTVASGGVLSTSGSSTSNDVLVREPVTNQAGGTVTIGSSSTVQDEGTLDSNAGSFTVSASGNFTLEGGSSFTQSAGTLKVSGSMSENSGTFTETGGAESGNAVLLSGGNLADSAGTGGFLIEGGVTLTGSIPSGQTVTVDGSAGNSTLDLGTAVTDSGTLVQNASPSGYALVEGDPLTVASGGALSTSGSSTSQTAYLREPLTNQAGGTVTIGSFSTLQDQGTLDSNAGSFTVSASGNLTLEGGSSFTQSAGTLTVAGSMSENSGTFTESGGAESGNPVVLTGGTLADSAGPGSFLTQGTVTLTGTIPPGQTVTVDGSAGNNSTNLGSAVTDNGTLVLNASPNGFALLSGVGLTVASGGVLATQGGSSNAYLRTPITNQAGGTVTIGAPTTVQDEGTLTANSGTLQVASGGLYTLSGGSTLTSSSTATLGVTANGTSGTGGITGPGVSLAGTLAVTTVGSPALGSTFTPIPGPVTGTFSALSFGPRAYAVTYPSGSVLLTTTAPFTAAATAFSPHQDIPTGAVQVASVGSAANGTGTYSATVNWGDGSAVQAATVTIIASTGTVVAPTHTYAHAGTFTVTATVANTDGTTLVTTESVVVPPLAVTHISPSSGPMTGGTKVTVTGSGFTGATKVAFGKTAGKSLTVVNDTTLTVVSPAQAPGVYAIRVTTPAGTSPAVTADQYTAIGPVVTAISPTGGPIKGGTTVTITGRGFTGATKVAFGKTAGKSLTVVDDTTITVVAPAEAPGAVAVRVTTPDGTSAAVAADLFTYVGPAVTAISPTSGPSKGGTTVTITGSGFTGATKVTFGKTAGKSLAVVDDTTITVRSPAGSSGAVAVKVTTPDGTSAAVAADLFTYS